MPEFLVMGGSQFRYRFSEPKSSQAAARLAIKSSEPTKMYLTLARFRIHKLAILCLLIQSNPQTAYFVKNLWGLLKLFKYCT